jgi:hypothetical protein
MSQTLSTPPGEPWPGPPLPPTPDGGPGIPNPPKTSEALGERSTTA